MIYACLLMYIKSSFTTSSISLPPCLRHPPYQGWIFRLGGQRPPFGQPTLDREGACGAGGWDDLCLFAHVRKKLIHHFKHQSSPLPSASPLSRVDFRIRRPEAAFSLAPSHRCRGVPEGEPSGLPFSSFFPNTFRQSVSFVPCSGCAPPDSEAGEFSTHTGFSYPPAYIPHIYSALHQQRHLPAPRTPHPAPRFFFNTHIPPIYSRRISAATFPIAPILPRCPIPPIQKSSKKKVSHIKTGALYLSLFLITNC